LSPDLTVARSSRDQRKKEEEKRLQTEKGKNLGRAEGDRWMQKKEGCQLEKEL